MSATSISVPLPADLDPLAVCGVNDCCLRALEDNLDGVGVWTRGEAIHVDGPGPLTSVAAQLVKEMIAEAVKGTPLDAEAVAAAARMLSPAAQLGPLDGLESDDILRARGRVIRAKSRGQRDYARAIDDHDVVFGIGPAGTGKTYLAMAKAVAALQAGRVKRLILTRPAVEAGESLGFLPGTLTQKIDPYVRPLYDALNEMLDPADLSQLMESGVIEVAPLAYMRGRTLNDAFIILDEAQNTTPPQMKMFLTRLGFGSKMVVTGDVSQIDLPRSTMSGLVMAQRVLEGVDGIAFAYLSSADVVRHQLVSRMIDAWDQFESRRINQDSASRGRGGGGRARSRREGRQSREGNR